MTEPRFDCLCAGIVVADHVCAPVEQLPAPGELVLTSRLQLTIGGCASNVAGDLAKLGVKAAIIGRVGNDVFGRHVREELEQAGVCCDHLLVSQTQQTAGTLVLNVHGEDRRFIHAIGANQEFDGSVLTSEFISQGRILYIGGYGLWESLTSERVADAFRRAQLAGVVTILDVVLPGEANYWPLIEPVLSWTDLFLPNNDEGELITQLSNPVDQADTFHQAGAKTVVVTCGSDGAVLVAEKERWRAKTANVEFVDGTGSGDAFVAGYVLGLLRGQATIDCLRYGSALGASCVQFTGATLGALNAEQLDEFLKQNEIPIESI